MERAWIAMLLLMFAMGMVTGMLFENGKPCHCTCEEPAK